MNSNISFNYSKKREKIRNFIFDSNFRLFPAYINDEIQFDFYEP